MAKIRLAFLCERFCCALAAWFPRVSVNIVMTWGMYVHVFCICLQELHGFYQAFMLVIGVALYILSTASYARVVETGGGSPLDIPGFTSAARDVENNLGPPPQVLNNVTCKENGEMRFCSKCMCWKPDRTHHCSSCKKCILRMDHHCPWFATCIGFNNHKFFAQFLIYVTAFCAVCFISSFRSVVAFLGNSDRVSSTYLTLNWVFLTVLSGVMGLAVGGFTAYTLYLVFHNKTTIEAMDEVRYKTNFPATDFRYSEAPSSRSLGNLFDLGWKRNWCEVMGHNAYEWLLPIRNSAQTNGTSFPIDEELWEEAQQRAAQEHEHHARQQDYLRRQRMMYREELLEDSMSADHDDESVPLKTFVRHA
jgi:palmitoyltransferase